MTARFCSLRFAQMQFHPRQVRLLEKVRLQGSVSVEALAEHFGVTLQTVRRDVQLLAEAGLLARFHGGVRVPGSTTENIAYRQRQLLNEAAKQRIARAVAQGGARRLLADHQHRHHDRGDRARADASPRPARDHQQPERRGDPDRPPRLRGDRRRRRGALARPRHRRRGDGGLHPPVQGRHRARSASRASRPTARCATSTTARSKVARAIIEHSREVWLAADHSKFNRPAMVELARLDNLDLLYTDAPPPDAVSAPAGRGRRAVRRADVRRRRRGDPMTYLLALDQGTSSSRSIVFDARGPHRRDGAARVPPDLPAARLGRARSAGDLGHAARHRAGGAGRRPG